MEFSHINEQGRAKMVDVTDKDVTYREAIAEGTVIVNLDTMALIKSGGVKKGDVLAVAQVAGIMAAKKTSDNIPMCHPLMLSGVDIRFELTDTAIHITATVKCKGSTGVEMEALSAVSTTALTIYDMCKAVQRDIEIQNIRLNYKNGGKSLNRDGFHLSIPEGRVLAGLVWLETLTGTDARKASYLPEGMDEESRKLLAETVHSYLSKR